MNTKVIWIITEMQNGQEIEVWETYSKQHAYAILCDYTTEDTEKLSPCMYKKIGNHMTTEF